MLRTATRDPCGWNRANGRRPLTRSLETSTRPSAATTWTIESSLLGSSRFAGTRSRRRSAATSSARVRVASSTPSTRLCRITTTRMIPPTTRASASTKHAAAAVRTRMPRRRLRRLAAIGVEAVAGPAHRLDGGTIERFVDLLAQVPDVDLDDVEVTDERVVPDVLDDLGLRHDVAGAPHEELEQRELP